MNWSTQQYNELERLRRQREILLLETDFGVFCKWAWRVLHPEETLVWCWAYDLLAEYLGLVASGRLLRLIANTPPRFLKTSLASIFWPSWVWTRCPHTTFLCASYSMDLSIEHNIARRNLIMSREYQALWGDRFRLSSDRNLSSEFTNDRHGAMIATAVGARTLGKGGDIIILDDAMSADMAMSDAERKSANDWINATLLQRLNNPRAGAIVAISQRLHQNDTTGFLLTEQPARWKHVKLQLVAECDESWQFPVSGLVVKRARGQILQPERFPETTVTEIQARRYVYSSQYQQEPSPIEGNLIKRADVRYFGGLDRVTGAADEPLPSQFDRKIISVDAAFKNFATSDYVAIGVIGVKGRKRYLLNVINQHLDAAATEAEIRRQHVVHSPISAVLIEDKANGSAVISRLKGNIPGVIAVTPQGGKIARLFAASPEWQAGDWFVDRNAAWTEPFIEQITMFPSARHDDMADMMSQAAIWLQSNIWNFCVLADFVEKQERELQEQEKHPGFYKAELCRTPDGRVLEWQERDQCWLYADTRQRYQPDEAPMKKSDERAPAPVPTDCSAMSAAALAGEECPRCGYKGIGDLGSSGFRCSGPECGLQWNPHRPDPHAGLPTRADLVGDWRSALKRGFIV